ncbi:E3 ubiquitin protein ligase DRIP2-like isoform X3 [Panicum virgatum]|uniref:E3 ubiquitin protein ligase DRIP2-like isoform X3 n=1 Tax=Panicum virgatum TaxID=38727 RepID=UPI0019D5A6D9|nr:E3 ubiquitin protein ligase DRIP2-like isoform X3 [Panicum virgatum]
MDSAVLACEATAAAAAPGAGGGGGVGDVVRLKRSALAACLTCPLCGRLLRDAAAITECLHTFCRKCISEEFINKEVCCCPICSIDLGCAPLEKLRIDHSLQFVRSKIFPKKQKVEGPEVTSSVASPIKRKERSLSSLKIPAPRVSMQKCLTKRRTKASRLRNLSLHTKLRGSNITKKVGGWRPLVDETPTSQSKTKRQFTRRGNLEKRTGSKKLLILTGKQKNIKPKLPNKKRKLRALWFNLVAAFDQKGQPPLPQVASKFLRIKDVDLPASFIQKYLMQKLNLSSEAEVDILCGGKPVSPGMTLHDLAGCWLNKGQKGRVRSSVGTPADGFIAKVFYGRSGSSKPETENNQD